MFIIYVTPVAFHIFVVIKKRFKKKRQTSNQQNLDNLQNALWLRSQTTLTRNISYSSAPPFTEISVFIYDLFCGIIEGLIKIIRQCENTTWQFKYLIALNCFIVAYEFGQTGYLQSARENLGSFFVICYPMYFKKTASKIFTELEGSKLFWIILK